MNLKKLPVGPSVLSQELQFWSSCGPLPYLQGRFLQGFLRMFSDGLSSGARASSGGRVLGAGSAGAGLAVTVTGLSCTKLGQRPK